MMQTVKVIKTFCKRMEIEEVNFYEYKSAKKIQIKRSMRINKEQNNSTYVYGSDIQRE